MPSQWQLRKLVNHGRDHALAATLRGRLRFFGCIGQMLPTAMGATLANGNKLVVLVDGEASTNMHLSDFDTIVRCKTRPYMVVLNDEVLGSESRGCACATRIERSRRPARLTAPAIGECAAVVAQVHTYMAKMHEQV